VPEASAELRAILMRWLRAVEAKDAAAISNMMSTGELTRYVGSDAHEAWSGADVARVLGLHLSELPPLGFEIDDDSVEAYADGKVGWGSAEVRFIRDGREPALVRNTSVWLLEDGVWRFVQIHNSLPSSNEEAIGVALTHTLDELLRSIGGSEVEEMADLSQQGTATLVFTDIEASTSTAAAVGDERWAQVIEWHDDTIRRVATSHGGTVVKTLGDGALLSFSSARAAVLCAIDVQKAIGSAAAPMPIAVRIGIHSGDVVRTGTDVVGNTVNVAARVTSAAAGGEVMTSVAIHSMLADAPDLRFGPPKQVRLKGYERLREVYPLLWD
jgi:adenylate cyclase